MEDHGGGGHIYGIPRVRLCRTIVGEDISMGPPGHICVGPWRGGLTYGVPRAHLCRTMVGEGLTMGYLGHICVGPWWGRA